jgi:hypothetical protein
MSYIYGIINQQIITVFLRAGQQNEFHPRKCDIHKPLVDPHFHMKLGLMKNFVQGFQSEMT